MGTMTLSGRGRRRLQRGHPWIYADDVAAGESQPGELVPVAAPDEDLRFRAAFFDITEWKLAEQKRHDLERQVLHAQKLESLGVLAGGIAHDFNNLMMVILGNADLALRSSSLAASEQQFLPEFLESWFRPETQQRIRGMVADLRR